LIIYNRKVIMGIINILTANISCPNCKEQSDFKIQFRYGETWNYEYKLGDVLKWGGNEVGKKGVKKVAVEGIGGPCPKCGTRFLNFEIEIKNDRIDNVKGLDHEKEYPSKEGYYEIIEE